MIQPFFHQVQMEGEYSFVFVDGDFCHAVIKKPKQGDYRVQSIYGGYEKKITPNCRDLTSAYNVIDALPLQMPLYARIDMIRGHDNQLMLMEAELIEPYLYPEQGPELGTKLTEGLIKGLNGIDSNKINKRSIIRLSTENKGENVKEFLQGLPLMT